MSESFFPEGSIPVIEADQMIANWKAFLADQEPDFDIRSFLIPIASFTNIVQFNPDAEAVRVHIGLEIADDPTSAKLIFIPVVDGKEVRRIIMPQGQPGSGTEVEGGDGSQSNTYDMSKSCPPYCTEEPPVE
ncbi:hypothetical protein FPZ42_15495 [Mucilaginibacter achroorhodeus]|uniref:Uncharacterized protein n=1 Tax=Mucilaginibacter achroorhodeus TaxID=2599294 RepID=A0A563TYZ5_9SPHI|nr:hypothetical protein [Mucilaginibacter achroorhodeus]TWR24503.1 hypothetical protein FPZ42_15495 [Mucilaginibacter achroorhodeus]